jgi:hypothetical protein
LKSEREFQRQIPMLLEMRHRDREQRDGLLVRVIGKDRAYQVLGEFECLCPPDYVDQRSLWVCQ